MLLLWEGRRGAEGIWTQQGALWMGGSRCCRVLSPGHLQGSWVRLAQPGSLHTTPWITIWDMGSVPRQNACGNKWVDVSVRRPVFGCLPRDNLGNLDMQKCTSVQLYTAVWSCFSGLLFYPCDPWLCPLPSKRASPLQFEVVGWRERAGLCCSCPALRPAERAGREPQAVCWGVQTSCWR